MISESILRVFKFVDFLHEKTEYFVGFLPKIKEYKELAAKYHELDGEGTYQQRKERKRLKPILEESLSSFQANITDVIISKAQELGINLEKDFIWLNYDVIQEPIEESEQKYFDLIIDAKKKYCDFRNNVPFDYLIGGFLWSELDYYLYRLFKHIQIENVDKDFEGFKQKTASEEDAKEFLNRLYPNEYTNAGKGEDKERDHFDYCDLGVLIVIEERITKNRHNYNFDGMTFETSKLLEKHLKENNITTTNSIRQYLDDTFGEGTTKDLKQPSRVKKIFAYYESKGCTIPDHIAKKYPQK